MTTENTKKGSGNVMVAASIVIAALIIGGAVIFTSNGKDNNAPTSDEVSAEGLDFIREVTEEDHIKGDINAPIKIIEFSDTECPFCARLQVTLDDVVNEFDGQVAWVYRHLPLTQLHPKAPAEAHATECAAELGGNDGFWKFIDRMYEVTPGNNGLDLATLPDIAEYAGLNRDEFIACQDSQKHLPLVQEDYVEGASFLKFLSENGVSAGTPTSVIITPEGEMIPVNGAQPKEFWLTTISELLGSE